MHLGYLYMMSIPLMVQLIFPAKSTGGKAALLGAADELESNGECWSRKVEEALYEGYGLPHPLNLV